MLVPPAGRIWFHRGYEPVSGKKIVYCYTTVKNVGVSIELATVCTHSSHEMLDEEYQAGLLNGAGLDLRPDDGDLFIGDDAIYATQV